jgi:hypothetical protein
MITFVFLGIVLQVIGTLFIFREVIQESKSGKYTTKKGLILLLAGFILEGVYYIAAK